MPRPFVPPGTDTHYTPDRPVGVTHVRLEVTLDLDAQSVRGRSELALAARRDGLTAVELNAVDMQIEEVTVDGEPAAGTSYDGQRLRIELGSARARGDRLTVSVAYRAIPRRGLYFVGPDVHHPDRPAQCWTQGQDEDSRHWWPCIDAPIEKATSELICTAPRGLFVLSNGDLRERADLDSDDGSPAQTRWRYALDLPHSPYLVTLVCGRFAEVKDKAPETGVDVHYFVPPGREEDARRTFGRTPQMIDFFSRRIGIPYPQRRYSQIVVSEFIFGGMENTTATTLTDQALLDERAALDHDVDGLVSHELAHQWWGDLLTCREWPEAWLNEGFATYFEYVWREHHKGRDEADVELLVDTDSYLAESGTYQRPIVCRQYEEPIDLFDSHLYEKGGRVLHMLRHEIGEDSFWRALALYAERHLQRSVETRDLARAVEDASGRNMDRFFDQWVSTAGHPELQGDWQWDADSGVGTLRLEQKQEGETLYTFAVPVRFEVRGEEHEQRVTVREKTHAFEFRLPAAPTQVIFDPGDVVLKTIRLDKARPLWVRQLKAAALAVDRVLAARALGERPEPAAVVALRESLEGDPLWAVRVAAASALGRTRRADALDALEAAARTQEHPKVRRAVATALGEFRGDGRAAATLARWVEEGDPSYFVEANAALSLGRTRSPAAVEVLSRALDRPAFQDVIRARVLEGLGASGDEAALAVVRPHYRPTASFQARRAAIAAVARLAEGTLEARRARELMETALDDRDFRVRIEAASSLALLGDGRAVAALERAAAAELDGRARRRIKEAITELRDRGRPPERVRKLEDEIERLRGEGTKLKERIEKLEARPPDSARPPRDRDRAGPPRRPRPGVRRPPKPPRPPRRRR
jgi:aminopeptidase N